jgi:hypothetical protein
MRKRFPTTIKSSRSTATPDALLALVRVLARQAASGKVGGARLVAKSELERLLSPAPDEAVEDINDENEDH